MERLKPRRIGRQIGVGYLLSIAIGWVGSMTGLVIADYFQGRGVFQLVDAQTQARLLSEFEQTAEEIHLQSLRTVVLKSDPEAVQAEVAALQQNLLTLQGIRQEFETFLNDRPVWLANTPETMRSLLADYDQQLTQHVADLLATSDTVDGQVPLPALILGETTPQLEQFHTELKALIRIAHIQESNAADVMEKAQGFEKFMIVVSITGAGLLAGLLAWRTTRAIAVPLETITQVAQEVANEADYDLRVPVWRNDEIGVLAQSLNHLIERVAERTASLEQAAQTTTAQNLALESTLQSLRQAQLQLVQAEKMSSLGQLVAGIAHEINNPIGFILGNLAYAQDYSETLLSLVDQWQAEGSDLSPALAQTLEAADLEFIRHDFPKVLQSLSNGANRLNSLVLSLKIFSRLQESHLKPANLNESLESVLVLLGHRLKPQAKRPEIEVRRDYDRLPMVDCYSSQLNQVFMNILTNAVDAIDERWERLSRDWQPCITLRTQQVGDRIRIQIGNNGTAIPPAAQAKVFDPFFTTKPVGQGVGLGLSISYEIVTQQHRGSLTFASPVEDEIGACFSLEIPTQATLTEAS